MTGSTPMLEEKTVLIAGVGKGLGREIAEAAFREGARVVLGARTLTVLEEEANRLDPSSERVLACRLDVTDRQSCADFVAAAAKKFGHVDVLVNLAALDTVFGGVQDAELGRLAQDVRGERLREPVHGRGCRAPLSPSGGAIVFVGSQTMYDPPALMPQAGYAASKAAMIGAMRHLTIELGRKRIRLNNVAPGWMWGPPVEDYVKYRPKKKGISEEEVLADLTKDMPLGEMATDGDVAEAVIFLASDRAHGITGQSLLVNAGEHMQ